MSYREWICESDERFFDIDRPNRVLKSQEKIEQKLWNRFLFFGSIFSYFSKPEVRL